MDRNQTKKTFSQLGSCMVKWANKVEMHNFSSKIGQKEIDSIDLAVVNAKINNGWFTEKEIRESFRNLGSALTSQKIERWIQAYPMVKEPQSVGLILPGNIPMVGFHDVLSTILSGNVAKIKLSSDDKYLIPVLLDIACLLQPELKSRYEIVNHLKNVDAVIATGSDNTARYFEKYFGHLPTIIRKNRTSIAVLSGEESKEELNALGKDVFTYFGLGCRNVSHLLLPKKFNLDRLFEAFIDFGEVVHHNKYGNNYDYYRAIYLMNQEQIFENGFLLTRETKDLFAPIAVLHYHYYEKEEEIKEYIEKYKEKIQVVVGKKYHPFGKTQSPALEEYADNVDTMAFLTNLA